jgi:hypothetical protein
MAIGLTFRADGVMLPGKTIIPRCIDFSSKMPSNLQCPLINGVQGGELGTILSHCLHAYAPLFGKENENLVRGICSMVGVEV